MGDDVADESGVDNLTAALGYVGRGLPVVPCYPAADGDCSCPRSHPSRDARTGQCTSPGKHPLTQHGLLDASSDPAQVRAWWRSWPRASVAISTGTACWALDVDPVHQGDAALAELEHRFGALPPTVRVQTGSGGLHIYFQADPRVTTSKGSLPDGLDVRGRNGYVLAPPSTHVTGRSYRWELGAALGDLPFARGPAWLLGLILNGRSRQASTARDEHERIPQGRRHSTLVKKGGLLRRLGYTADEIFGLLRVLNTTRCQPPLDEAAVAKIAASLERYAPGARATGPAPGPEGPVEDRTEEVSSTPSAPHRVWPAPLEPEAFHGLAGDLVHAIAPDTEADPVALLLQTLVAFGSAVGRTAYLRIEGDHHFSNLFCVLVGETSKGRKGTAWGQVKRYFSLADPEWMKARVLGGLSSGEGLIWAVRDPIRKLEKAPRSKGEALTYEEVIVDQGVADKRLFVLEPEFATVLRRIEREGNSLSGVMRLAWDTGHLSTMTKNFPAVATDAHVAIVGHVTKGELVRYLPRTELANGFANRFLFACVRRSKMLPRGGRLTDAGLLPLVQRLEGATDHARRTPQLAVSDPAWEVWEAVYPQLSDERPGLVGAMLSRAEAQTMRLAGVYALLDGSSVVRPAHILAALAVWQYCEASVEYVFGDAVGDPVADELLRALRAAGTAGLTRTEIRDLFGRHRSAAELGRALGALLEEHLARMVKEATGGRHAERWVAADPTATSDQSDGSDQRQDGGGLRSHRALRSLVAVGREVVQRQSAAHGRELGQEG